MTNDHSNRMQMECGFDGYLCEMCQKFKKVIKPGHDLTHDIYSPTYRWVYISWVKDYIYHSFDVRKAEKNIKGKWRVYEYVIDDECRTLFDKVFTNVDKVVELYVKKTY